MLAGAWALGEQFSVIHFFVIVPIATFIALMPISIAGLGVRETAFVYFFGLIGMSPHAAFVLSILVLLVSTLMALPGAWFYATGASSRAKQQAVG